MLELPEVINMAKQLNQYAVGKTVAEVLPPTKQHKFCWFNGDVNEYEGLINGAVVTDVVGFGLYVEMVFDNGKRLCVNDGVNIRLCRDQDVPKDFQLLIKLEADSSLVFTVAMYGGIVLHAGDYDNEYYKKSKLALSPFDDSFRSYFYRLLDTSKQNLSAKAFLATEQRFPGIGNGVLQDILFVAGIHPRRKIGSMNDDEREVLFNSTIKVLKQMTDNGGRDTEKDLYCKTCGYKTILSKNTLSWPCPKCGEAIQKEAYLGGAVYYCPECQK